MSEMRRAAEIWRDFVTGDGPPRHQPHKGEIRPWGAALEEWARSTPEWWGAVGDGVASDGQAFADLIASGPLGGVINLTPRRTYKLDSGSILLPNNTALSGNGATIEIHNGTGEHPFLMRDVADVSIDRLRLVDKTFEVWLLGSVAGAPIIVGQTVTNVVTGSTPQASGIVRAVAGTTVTVERTTVRGIFAEEQVVNFSGGGSARTCRTMNYISPSGMFQVGEAFTATDGRSGFIVAIDIANNRIGLNKTAGGAWANGNIVTGGTSGATCTVTTFYTKDGSAYYKPLNDGFSMQNASRITLTECAAERFRHYGFVVSQNTDSQVGLPCDDINTLYCRAQDCGFFGFEYFPKALSNGQLTQGCVASWCGHEPSTAGAGFKVGTLCTGAALLQFRTEYCNFGVANGLWDINHVAHGQIINSFQYSLAVGFTEHSVDVDAQQRSLLMEDIQISHTEDFTPEGGHGFAGLYLYGAVQQENLGSVIFRKITMSGLKYRPYELVNETEIFGVELQEIRAIQCDGIGSMVNQRPPNWAPGATLRGNARRVNAANGMIYQSRTYVPTGAPTPITGTTAPTHMVGDVLLEGITYRAIAYVGADLGGGNNEVKYFLAGLRIEDMTIDWTGVERSTNLCRLRGKNATFLGINVIRAGEQPFVVEGDGNIYGNLAVLYGNSSNIPVAAAVVVPGDDKTKHDVDGLRVVNGFTKIWAPGIVVAKGERLRTARDRIYRYSVAGTTGGAAPAHEGGVAADGTATAVYDVIWPKKRFPWVAGGIAVDGNYYTVDGLTWRCTFAGIFSLVAPTHTTGSQVNGTATLFYVIPPGIGAVGNFFSSAFAAPEIHAQNCTADSLVRMKSGSDMATLISTEITELTGKTRVKHGIAAPTTGTYEVGDVVMNDAPTLLRNIAYWKCIIQGTPGTWVAYGQGQGTTGNKPTPLANDTGYQYYDTTVGRLETWSGVAWLVA